MQILIVLGLSIAIFAVTFALQNPGIIIIKFMMWEFTGSLALVLLMTFALGFISSIFVSLAKLISKKLSAEEQPPKVDSNTNT